MKTPAQRQADMKKKRAAVGFRQLLEWVHDKDRDELKAYARVLRAQRFEQMERDRL